MKQYLLAVHSVEGEPDMPEEQMQAMFDETGRINDDMQAKGAWVFGGGLLGPDSSTVVRTGPGGTTMTDGPFAETREHLAGFWVVRCQDLDEALAWAERASRVCGPVEVRPFDEMSQG